MNYKIRKAGNTFLIKSENAALSPAHQSSLLTTWISQQPVQEKVLDYGCGKLRYTRNLREIADSTLLVDSAVQLDRTQTVYGVSTSIRDFVHKKWNDVTVCTIDEFARRDEKFNLILCSNVLSAIPSKKEVSATLLRLKKALHKDGKCLIVNQHRNSYFNISKKKEGSFKHAYGWIQEGMRGYSYYGIIDRALLEKILPRAGFKIDRLWIGGQSTFVECH